MDEMETLWIPDNDFKLYIDQAGDRATLAGIDGKTRWVVTGEDGFKYIVRPESSKNQANEDVDTAKVS